MSPKRIQRRRTRGWRKPEGAVYVGRGSRWGNPFAAGETQLRIPPVYFPDEEWELEGRAYKRSEQRHSFTHADGSVTWHQVEDATPEQLVILFRAYLAGGGVWPISTKGLYWPPTVEKIREELTGKTLMRWCPEDQPCHADVLLEIANAGVEA